MNFLRQTLNKVKHFPEFHNMIDAYDHMKNSEQKIFIEQGQAYPAAKQYGSTQHESITEALEEISNSGTRQLAAENEALSSLSSFTNDLQPLLQQETEISKWREVCAKMDTEANKSKAAAEKANTQLQKAKLTNSNVPKFEADYNAKQRKADDDLKNAQSQRQKLEEQEGPYKVKFLESYVTPVNGMLEIKIKAAESLKSIAPEFLDAAEKLQDLEHTTASLQKLIDDLEKYNQITIE